MPCCMKAQVGLSSCAGDACTCHLGVVCRERELREDIAQMTDQLEKQKAVTQKTMQVDLCNSARGHTVSYTGCGGRGWVQGAEEGLGTVGGGRAGYSRWWEGLGTVGGGRAGATLLRFLLSFQRHYRFRSRSLK